MCMPTTVKAIAALETALNNVLESAVQRGERTSSGPNRGWGFCSNRAKGQNTRPCVRPEARMGH